MTKEFIKFVPVLIYAGIIIVLSFCKKKPFTTVLVRMNTGKSEDVITVRRLLAGVIGIIMMGVIIIFK